jgi:hypothetical protein
VLDTNFRVKLQEGFVHEKWNAVPSHPLNSDDALPVGEGKVLRDSFVRDGDLSTQDSGRKFSAASLHVLYEAT